MTKNRANELGTIDTLISPKWLPVLALCLVLYAVFVLDYVQTVRSNTDIPTFYSASVSAFRTGLPPYDRERLERSTDFGGASPHVYPYLYPPPSLLLFAPLSALDYRGAVRVQLIANLVILLALLCLIPWALLYGWRSRDPTVFLLAFAYSLAAYPTLLTLDHGQVNLFVLASLVLFWVLEKEERPVVAALFLALAVLLKTYPLVIVLMLFVLGRRRVSLYTVGWLAFVSGLSFFVLPKGTWSDWVSRVMPTGGYGQTPLDLFSPAAIWNQSINGFVSRALIASEWSHPVFVNQGLASALTYILATSVVAMSLLVLWRGSRGRPDTVDRTLMVALPVMYLIAPLSWEHHIVYLLPSILMLLVCRTKLQVMGKTVFYCLLTASAVLLATSALLELKFYAVVILWGLCLFAVSSDKILLPHDREQVA